jgi:uncharacterized protein YbjQ (UPF0145 family)
MPAKPDDFSNFVDDILSDAEPSADANGAAAQTQKRASPGSGIMSQNESVRLTTTEFFVKQGWRVVETLPMITANRVVGTKFVSDASVNADDLVGARSKQAEMAFARMEVEVFRDLRAKAARKGAGAVVGVRVEFGEVSGTDKGQMFYAFAQGTPVMLGPDPYFQAAQQT